MPTNQIILVSVATNYLARRQERWSICWRSRVYATWARERGDSEADGSVAILRSASTWRRMTSRRRCREVMERINLQLVQVHHRRDPRGGWHVWYKKHHSAQMIYKRSLDETPSADGSRTEKTIWSSGSQCSTHIVFEVTSFGTFVNFCKFCS